MKYFVLTFAYSYKSLYLKVQNLFEHIINLLYYSALNLLKQLTN